MVLAMMHCAGLEGLLAFVSSVVIPEPTLPPSSLSLSSSPTLTEVSTSVALEEARMLTSSKAYPNPDPATSRLRSSLTLA